MRCCLPQVPPQVSLITSRGTVALVDRAWTWAWCRSRGGRVRVSCRRRVLLVVHNGRAGQGAQSSGEKVATIASLPAWTHGVQVALVARVLLSRLNRGGRLLSCPGHGGWRRAGGWPHPTGKCRRWCGGGEGAASRGAGRPPPAGEMIGCFLEGSYEQVTVGHASRSLGAGSANDRRLLGRSQAFAEQVDEVTLSR